VKTAETQYALLDAQIENGEKRIKDLESSSAKSICENHVADAEITNSIKDAEARIDVMNAKMGELTAYNSRIAVETIGKQQKMDEWLFKHVQQTDRTLAANLVLVQKLIVDGHAKDAQVTRAIITKAFISLDERVQEIEDRVGIQGQLGEYGETIINRMNLIEDRFNLYRTKRYCFRRNWENNAHDETNHDESNCDNLMQMHDESNCDYLLHACVPQPPSVEDRDLLLQNPSFDPAVSTVNSQLICASHQMHTTSYDKDLQDSSQDSSESDMRSHECEEHPGSLHPFDVLSVVHEAPTYPAPAGPTV